MLPGFSRRLLPFLAWLPAISRNSLRPDLEAGLICAVLILPQAIALATLAGMPPEYGIYTSIFPVLVAALWGSSWHALSGPNTAVCVLLAFSVAPFAAVGSEHYIGYVLALTFMAGIIQLSVGMLRLGAILDFISHTVIGAIVLAVALIIIVSAASSLLGVLSNPGETFFIQLYQLVHDVPRANIFAAGVGMVTVVVGLAARYWWRRYALLIAVVTGSLAALALNLFYGSVTTKIGLLGFLSVSPLPLSMPDFNLESMAVLKELSASAVSIAFLGLMQTIVIARSLSAKSGQHIDTNQEIVGQGLANMVAPFVSSFAGSGSFNRSAVNYEAGARTPLAAVYASVILAALALVGGPLMAYLPTPVVAASLVLVGLSLVDWREARQALRSQHEAVIFFTTFVVALGLGINTGVFTGLLVSLAIYLWYASTPNITIEEYPARNGSLVQAVTIDGGLFFGSLRHVERALARLTEHDEAQSVLLLKADHVTYIDVPGIAMIAAEAKRRRMRGSDLYVYVTTAKIMSAIAGSGYMESIGHDHVIQRDRDHPMKDVLWPFRSPVSAPRQAGKLSGKMQAVRGELPMKELIKRIKAKKFFSPLSLDQISSLLEHSLRGTAHIGDIISASDATMREHLVLLDGTLETVRSWNEADGSVKSATRVIKSIAADGDPVILTAARRITVRALSEVHYLLINADTVEEMIGWSQQITSLPDTDTAIKRRMELVRRNTVFRQLPLENVYTAFLRMVLREAESGETVIRQGEAGDCYYLIESGEAEVWRTDPLTNDTALVNTLDRGDAFGEEALLQSGYRNATVKMITPGKLLTLQKSDFDELVRPGFVEEVTPDGALDLVSKRQARWLDCRYDMEYEEGRIPGAQLMPLDRLRELTHNLDPASLYIVYCRSGRRSKAAAFLLRERNIKAVSLAGGIKEWPYEIDAQPTR
jgi:SulP family sulfate permease